MPKPVKILLAAAAAALVLLVALDPFGVVDGSSDFDIGSQALVEVILRDHNDGTIHYDAVGPDRTRRETQPFESDPLRIVHAAPGCFVSYTEEGPVNRLDHVALIDDDGQSAESSPAIERIFEKVTALDHTILGLTILEHEDALFACVTLNVNLWTPCRLYHYDPAVDQLTELYTYDSTDVIGLRIRNLLRQKG